MARTVSLVKVGTRRRLADAMGGCLLNIGGTSKCSVMCKTCVSLGTVLSNAKDELGSAADRRVDQNELSPPSRLSL